MPRIIINGQEVNDPIVKWIVLPIYWIINFVVLVIEVVLAIIAFVILLPIHPIMRLFGREGFYKIRNRGIIFDITGESFRRKR